MMSQSFLENQNMITKLQMMKRRLIVEPLYYKAIEIECPTCSPDEVA